MIGVGVGDGVGETGTTLLANAAAPDSANKLSPALTGAGRQNIKAHKKAVNVILRLKCRRLPSGQIFTQT